MKTADEYFSRSDVDEDGEQKEATVVMFCKHTHYAVVKEVGKVWLEYHLTRNEKSDWDIWWSDAPVNEKFLKSM